MGDVIHLLHDGRLETLLSSFVNVAPDLDEKLLDGGGLRFACSRKIWSHCYCRDADQGEACAYGTPDAFADGGAWIGEREVETRIMTLLNAASRDSPKPWQLFALGVSIRLALLLLVSPLHHGSEWVITFLATDSPHLH